MTAATKTKQCLVPCGGCGGSKRFVDDGRVELCDVCNGTGKLTVVPGVPVTILARGQMRPATVIDVTPCGTEVDVREDKVRKGRFFLPGETVHIFTRRVDGSWRLRGANKPLLSFGVRCSGRPS